MKKFSSFLFVLACSQFLAPSCSKKSSSSATTCKLTTIVDQVGANPATTIDIAYDANGRVSGLTSTSSTSTINKVYAYSGSSLVVTMTSTAGNSVDSIVLNSNGDMVSDMNISPLNRVWTTYTYGNNNQIRQALTQVNNDPIDTANYTFTNGDLTSISEGASTTTLTYNTAKTASAGDYLQVLQLLNFGAPYIVSAHQVASYATAATTSNFTYYTDNTGKISSLTITSGISTETLTYTYQCN